MPSRSAKALRVGLTGGFGSGKSTVLSMFRHKGAVVMDADAIVHDLFARSTRLKSAIRRRFGPESVEKNGAVNRRYLAKRIFGSARDRQALEKLIHPEVRRVYLSRMGKLHRGVAVVDIPLLYETGAQKKFDVIVVVKASRARRIRRLAARGFSARDFQRRARAQWPLARKTRLADFVVDNDGPKARTKQQIDEIWQRIQTSHARVVRGKNGRTKRT